MNSLLTHALDVLKSLYKCNTSELNLPRHLVLHSIMKKRKVNKKKRNKVSAIFTLHWMC